MSKYFSVAVGLLVWVLLLPTIQPIEAAEIRVTARQELICRANLTRMRWSGPGRLRGAVSVFCNSPSGFSLSFAGAGVREVTVAGRGLDASNRLSFHAGRQPTQRLLPVTVKVDDGVAEVNYSLQISVQPL